MRFVVADEDVDSKNDTMVQPRLTDEQNKQLREDIKEFGDVVTNTLGLAHGVEHRIDTKDHTRIRVLPYRIAPSWKEQLNEEISLLLKNGIIRSSISPWSFPMVPIRKPDGSVRLCIDYRKLNAITTPDPYAIPLIETLIDELGESAILFKLDMNKGFYQIPVAESDFQKTVFCMPWGKYEFLRMSFGLRNAPATFQRCMNSVLQGMNGYSNAYIDDIIVFSKSWEEHVRHITCVLSRLRSIGIRVKPSKCEWGATSLQYLGHVVGKGVVSVTNAKVHNVRMLLVKELEQF